ncbi:MAG: ornithine carbamoyltransferase [Dehalococcoidia bacterium]|nr:ornithine carbamoyltransferase [Dehalococcoidia bacterium]
MLSTLLKISDCSYDDLNNIIISGIEFKKGKKSNILDNKTGVLLFDKPSLRTKLSFMVGIEKLGGNSLYFSPEEIGMGTREPIPDVSSVVSRMADLAIIRTFEQSKIESYSKFSSIPVINALTDDEHPCQALADIMTIYENHGDIKNKNIAFIGDSNNVAKSLGYAVLTLGGNFSVASPEGYSFDKKTMDLFYTLGNKKFKSTESPEDIIIDADIVYTDVWTSMGQESEKKQRLIDFKDFQITTELLDKTSINTKFMHDLPAHPGEEIEDGLLYNSKSIVFDQAENRLWAQTALIEYIFRSL